jgi:DNA adenine methylase
MAEPCLPYVGSKKEINDWIIPMMPEHEVYGEIFGGSGSTLCEKPKAKMEVYNDRNRLVSNFFEVLRTKPDEFIKQLSVMPYSEVLNKTYSSEGFEKIYEVELGDVEMALRWYYLIQTSFHNKVNGGFAAYNADTVKAVKDLSSKIPSIEAVAKRFSGVQVWNKNFDDAILRLDSDKTLLFLDPPYIETEYFYNNLIKKGEIFFAKEDHVRLADQLVMCKSKVMLCYEWHPLLEDLYPIHDGGGWYVHKKQKNRSSKKEKAVEVVITNFQPTNTLFHGTTGEQ